ncbi:hypothetical protein GDO81_019052 [Engystomops pustulosus]|uniref:Uncharacterized protein n=1 Tax=Engystomops pustulosus TaxID=76066 RepID=A0AAV6YG57_ENGPU|nr:hypothetical protein GDO81_019052 [Engystomops pustulosus]
MERAAGLRRDVRQEKGWIASVAVARSLTAVLHSRGRREGERERRRQRDRAKRIESKKEKSVDRGEGKQSQESPDNATAAWTT